MSTHEIDDALAHTICTSFEHGGRHFDEGSFVAIEGGRMLGVGSTFEEADALLQRSGIAIGEGTVCEVKPPCRVVIR